MPPLITKLSLGSELDIGPKSVFTIDHSVSATLI